ncbi:MAG: beta-ketoacyl synthase N-terminal-like domain-containing protein, partial [Planctomycetaceae bacterium]|nr:beta-ketoacyl synthase N-terminal-like domain-containing protein [Planctomycetaceae bacterium]
MGRRPVASYDAGFSTSRRIGIFLGTASVTLADERIAIVGVGGIFPGARDLAAFWQNIAEGVDTGRNVPPGRWALSADKAFAAGTPQPDRVYSTWGCFLDDVPPAWEGLCLDPDEVLGLDPLFTIGLNAAAMAWRDAGAPQVDPQRAGVIFGHIVLPTEATSGLARDALLTAFAEQLLG